MDRTAIDSISHARGRQLFARQIRICWNDRVPLSWRGPSTCPKPRWIRDSPSVHSTSRSIDDRRRPDRWGRPPRGIFGIHVHRTIRTRAHMYGRLVDVVTPLLLQTCRLMCYRTFSSLQTDTTTRQFQRWNPRNTRSSHARRAITP